MGHALFLIPFWLFPTPSKTSLFRLFYISNFGQLILKAPSIILVACPFGVLYLDLHLSWAPCEMNPQVFIFQKKIFFHNETNPLELERS